MAWRLDRIPEPLRQMLPVAAGLVLVLAAGVVHGLWTRRWSGNHDIEAAIARLTHVPAVVGDWKGKDQPLDEERLARAEAAGHLRRIYTQGRSKQTISVVLLCGRFGPLSVHTPDVCYSGAGYEMVGAPVRGTLRLNDGTTAEFWTARFHKPHSPGSPPLRLCWAWNAGEGWKAPKWPRWTFRMAPVLFKLYVSREMNRLDEPLGGDPCLAFLREWLPRADRTLFGKSPMRTPLPGDGPDR